MSYVSTLLEILDEVRIAFVILVDVDVSTLLEILAARWGRATELS